MSADHILLLTYQQAIGSENKEWGQ